MHPPSRITTALCALQYCHTVELGGLIDLPGGARRVPPRQLEPRELGLRATAIEFLRNFISGEVEFSVNGGQANRIPDQLDSLGDFEIEGQV